jgi:hypothetical protein
MPTTTIAPAIDKRAAAQTIRHLMQLWGLDWDELQKLDTPAALPQKGEIPPIWHKVRGMLKGRKIDPIAYEDQIRAEWAHRP